MNAQKLKDAFKKRYKIIFDNANDAMVFVNKSGIILDANKTALKMFGGKREDAIGKHFTKLKIYKIEHMPSIISQFVKTVGKKSGFMELEIINRKGKKLFIECSTQNIKEDSKIKYIVAIIRDVTNKKMEQKKLIGSELRYRKFFDFCPFGIITLNENGFVTSCNNAFLKKSSFSKKEIVGVHFSKMPTIKKTLKKNYINIFKGFLKGKYPKYIDFDWMNKREEKRKAEAYGTAIETEGRKEILFIVKDITERKVAQEKITKERDRAQKYLDVVETVLVALDKNGKVTLINKKGCKVLDLRENEIIKRDWIKNFIPKEFRGSIQKNFKRIMEGKMNLTEYYTSPIMKKNGEYRLIEWHNTLIQDKNGKILGILSSGQDITEKKKSQEDLKKAYEKLKNINDIRTEFMNVVTHELKTPLIPIIGYTDLLLLEDIGELNQKQREILRVISKNAKKLGKLTQDVLNIAKLESDVMKFDMKKIKIENIITDSLRNFKPLAQEKRLKLCSNIEKNLPYIYGDALRIGEVFNNLIENAIKFTDTGSVTVSAKKADNTISFSIKDTGQGISKEFMPKIFEKFQQEKTAEGRKHGGTGLGLAICKKIIEKHDGKICVKSTNGKGTTFYFKIPIKK